MIYALSNDFTRRNDGLVISLSFLFILPAALTALIVFLTDMSGRRHKRHYTQIPLWIMGAILLASAITLREGVICVLMISPFWWLSSWAGSRAVYGLQKKYKVDNTLNCFVLAVIPFLTLFAEENIQQPTHHYVVERDVTINASAQDVWPLLVKLDNIQPEEGRWNITQNLLGVPKPAMATIDMERVPYVRHAQWGDHVTFEEHITTFDVNQNISWDFVFPNDSVSEHTDRHISADGYHLKIMSGGYRLEALSPTKTRLTLKTKYRATSPVNFYAKLWGELILGDIQNNILTLIAVRAESKIS